MQGHRRRRATQRSPATPISPKGGGGTASISLSLLLHDVTDIASSSLRELDAVPLATNVTIFMERGTYPRASLEGVFNRRALLDRHQPPAAPYSIGQLV